ncbi:hypothetical protein BD410DRAFT_384645 [Rickenella mellea]|uniref:Uncharacterized protein n=1 Tax=Rickenella mellea TaxID=50990 RepID=A0A4Y7PXQ7_9AGAM|nr:hypothetical protein BD410DRAFT_384645 [Rickenella mellea]
MNLPVFAIGLTESAAIRVDHSRSRSSSPHLRVNVWLYPRRMWKPWLLCFKSKERLLPPRTVCYCYDPELKSALNVL